ncbi:MAG TPA: ParB/RepB/Spo0J family partition protein [Longimicrobiales bacterium]|nr:ParB/RepB/Spo0J family partition protein [Longimicrobiales bacterium]
MTRRDRLGKGLGALLGQYLDPEVEEAEIRRVRVAAIVPNPLQPRRSFTETELEELASSIRENGLLQPLVVRHAPGATDRFELVAGERRFRAISRLGWEDVPVLVREASDDTLLVLALVENLQREALNPMEEAEGYRALADRFAMSQSDIARAMGKDRSTVANLLRLLNLPPSVRKLVETGDLSMGHARALLSLEDGIRAGELARTAVREGWSVREMERQTGQEAPRKKTRKPKSQGSSDPLVRALEEALQESLSTRVTIRRTRKGKGVIEITFHGSEDFERVFELVTGKEAAEVVG